LTLAEILAREPEASLEPLVATERVEREVDRFGLGQRDAVVDDVELALDATLVDGLEDEILWLAQCWRETLGRSEALAADVLPNDGTKACSESFPREGRRHLHDVTYGATGLKPSDPVDD